MMGMTTATMTADETEAAYMRRIGFESGKADRRDGDYSAPIEAEDGPDYTAGYLAGWNAA